jgi:phosphoribosylanthranilate isomerase
MKIKICGIKMLDEALAAVEAGADLLGFNFYPPSPRYIAPVECSRLIGALRRRGMAFVGVGIFVNASPQAIAAILDDCGLDVAQLSGDESPADMATLGDRAFKAIRPASFVVAQSQAQIYGRRPTPPALLLDAAVGSGQFGGAGRIGDWDTARRLATRYPLLLAGGLRPENVAAAVACVRPWGVDVASGVEAAPGRKDPAKVAAFVRAARGDFADDR